MSAAQPVTFTMLALIGSTAAAEDATLGPPLAVLQAQHSSFHTHLQLPIINLGLPKSGSSSVKDFFDCGGAKASHYQCKDTRNERHPCGVCAWKNRRAGRPLLDGCGSYDVWAQIDVDGSLRADQGIEGTCFLPQVDALELLHRDYPQATFVLPTRPAEHWIASITSWHPNAEKGVPGMRERLLSCGLPGLEPGDGDEAFIAFYLNHSKAVRDFVAAHPSHQLIEFDLEAEGAGEKLEKMSGVPSTCWGKANCKASCEFWEELDMLVANDVRREIR